MLSPHPTLGIPSCSLRYTYGAMRIRLDRAISEADTGTFSGSTRQVESAALREEAMARRPGLNEIASRTLNCCRTVAAARRCGDHFMSVSVHVSRSSQAYTPQSLSASPWACRQCFRKAEQQQLSATSPRSGIGHSQSGLAHRMHMFSDLHNRKIQATRLRVGEFR
jgi:hypothetical protein